MEEVAVTQLRLADGLDVRQAGQQFAEDRGQLATGQLRTQAVVDSTAAECDMLVRRARQIKALRMIEHLGVPVGRGVEHDHLVALGDLVAAEFGVMGGSAPEGHDRGGPADDLLDGQRQAAIEVLQEPGALLREIGERLESVGDRLSGGVIAGDDQQGEDRRDVVVGQPFAVDFGLDHRSHQVVLRLAAAGGDEFVGDAMNGGDGLEYPGQRVGALQQSRITPAVGELRFVGDGAAVFLWDADHVADVVHRNQGGHLGDEVDLALGGDVVDDAAGVGDDVLVDPGQLFGCEGRRHQAADLGVPGGIHRDEALGRVENLQWQRLEGNALTGEEITGPPGHLNEVGVAHHGPETLIVGIGEHAVAHRAVPGDRAVGAQLGENLLAVCRGGRPELRGGDVGGVIRSLGTGQGGGHSTSI